MIVAAMLLVGSAWIANVTIDRVIAALAKLVDSEIAVFDRTIGLLLPQRLGLGPASRAPIVLLAMLIVGVVCLLWKVSRIPNENSSTSRWGWRLKWKRTFKTVLKYLHAAKGNLLWGLFGLPVILALSMSALALFSYIFFHLPYMRATRMARAKLPA
jgi:hypothetical protein